MERIKDGYLETIESMVPLVGKTILEVGCGNGNRTVQIARRCSCVIAVDPQAGLIVQAQSQQPADNIQYLVASADVIPVTDHRVDIVLFTLSLHHIPIEKMETAIDEAMRVVKPDGHIIFFEPTFTGSFFQAEMLFDACDGDERKQKAAAYTAMLSHPGLREIDERFDETVFSFESVEDFVSCFTPKGGSKEEIEVFLGQSQYRLQAERRINVFTLA